MKFTTIKSLSSNVYTVRFETDFSTSEEDLIDAYGDPQISTGGYFYGDTISYTGSIVLNQTITQGSARGKMVVDGTVLRFTTVSFSTGAIDGGLATITAAADITYTISVGTKYLQANFPYTKSFTNQDDADVFAAEIKRRADNAIETLRSQADTFSGEEVETL